MKHNKTDEMRSIIRARGLHNPLDVALVGATGVGKSSTINALFGDEVAKVGRGVDPETMEISEYQVSDVFRVHDSAGFGDGLAADKMHAINLSNLLLKTFTNHSENYGFIDMVLVILDGASRDLGTTYQLLEQVVLKCIEPSRVIVAINQADMAMSGRNWNNAENKPEEKLKIFLDEKANSIRERLKEATGLSISKPIYYSALENYNINALMDSIIEHMPYERRKTK